MGWCWAGLATVAVLGLSLADASDLFSPTEQLWRLDTGWLSAWEEFGIQHGAALEVTPLAAWWGMAVGGLMALVGWRGGRERLPFGWIGAAIWLTTLGQLLAGNLLIQWTMLSAQAMCCGLWWARHIKENDSGRGLRSFLFATLVGDAIELWGALLAGLAWGTLSFSELSRNEVLHAGWRNRPAVCGLAGMLLFAGVLGHGGLFPFVSGTRIAAQANAAASALVLSVCLWPSLLWSLLRMRPLLGVAPETVALVQGWSLLAAGAAAFVATGQAGVRRVVALLATSQIAMLLSILAVPPPLFPAWVVLTGATLSLATTCLFASPAGGFSRIVCWGVLACGCFSPMFWLSAQAVEQFQQWPAESAKANSPVARDLIAAEEAPTEDAYRVQPLPVATWTAVWCLVSFLGSFAAWRGWQLAGEEASLRDRANESQKDEDNSIVLSDTRSLTLSLLFTLTVIVCTVLSTWLAIRGGVTPFRWPVGAAVLSTVAGGVTAWWVCRDPGRRDLRFRQLGGWADLAERELALPELAGRMHDRWLSPLAELAYALEQRQPSSRTNAPWTELARRIVAAADELRSEPDVFYAGALLLTIGSLLLTWWTLAG